MPFAAGDLDVTFIHELSHLFGNWPVGIPVPHPFTGNEVLRPPTFRRPGLNDHGYYNPADSTYFLDDKLVDLTLKQKLQNASTFENFILFMYDSAIRQREE